MKEYDCHFQFISVVETCGRDINGAIENIKEIFNSEAVNCVEEIFSAGLGFDDENIKAREIKNGWFELKLLWSGYWTIDADDENSARKFAEELLDEKLTPFHRFVENIATKTKLLSFNGLEKEEISDVVIC